MERLEQELAAFQSLSSNGSKEGSLSSEFSFIINDVSHLEQPKVRYVRVQCLGVTEEDINFDVEEVEGVHRAVFVSVTRQKSLGLAEASWSHEFRFDDGVFEFEGAKLEFGFLLLTFLEKVVKVRRFNALSREISSCMGNARNKDQRTLDATGSVGSFELIPGAHSDSCPEGHSEASSSVKCFLRDTAFPTPDGHLLLVQNIKVGDKVKLSNEEEARVAFVKQHKSTKKKQLLVELVTCQGIFRVSEGHRVAVCMHESSPEEKFAEQLVVGDQVIVGSKARPLTKVRHLKERTELWMVGFEPDGLLEIFPMPPWGMQTWGTAQTGPDLLRLVGIPNVSELDLIDAMPSDYDD